MLPFDLPLLQRPILWYGFFFALGFILAYWVVLKILKESKKEDIAKHATLLTDRLALYIALGTVLGARLGDLLFYQKLGDLIRDPLAIIRVWEGGLASHGGAIGILTALALFSWRFAKRFPALTWLFLVDLIAIVAPLTGGCIRLGNFFNQEILGKPTTLPWGVIFGHPMGGETLVPRHPVQLYEALYYLALFFLLFSLRKRPFFQQKGRMAGLALAAIFSFRFLIEFLKEEQSVYLNPGSFLTMGQYLSLPLIGLGLFLLLRKKRA